MAFLALLMLIWLIQRDIKTLQERVRHLEVRNSVTWRLLLEHLKGKNIDVWEDNDGTTNIEVTDNKEDWT